jgi:soluble lytic murein transglycosylase-like protein
MNAIVLALAIWVAATPPTLGVPFEPEIDAAIAETAAVYPVPKVLVVAIIFVESSFNARAVSRAGAVGLMQLMPDTARRVGIPSQTLMAVRPNILGGVRFLAVLLRHYEGDVVSALVAYNARPRRRFAPLPANGETPHYVWKVLSRARLLQVPDRGHAPRTGRAATSARYSWTEPIATEPSPAAAATRLTEP